MGLYAGAIAAWGREGVARELLVGFDPVSIFVSKLEQRFGHLGSFFMDSFGGEVIAIKWKSQVWL